METTIRITDKVDTYVRKIGDYTVKIYRSDEIIVFSSLKEGQAIKKYYCIVQTIKNGVETDLMGYLDPLPKDRIEEQFQLIEKNVKEQNNLHSQEQYKDQRSFKRAIQRIKSFLD